MDNTLEDITSVRSCNALTNLFKTPNKNLNYKQNRAKKLLRSMVAKSLVDKDGDLCTKWKSGPSAKLLKASILRKGYRIDMKKEPAKQKKAKRVGAWKTILFWFDTKLPLRSMPRVNHLCGNVQLSGKDAIRKVIKSLSWPREIGIHSFDGPCISGKEVAERGSKRRRVVACYGRVKCLGPFLAKIFADLINEQQFKVPS